MRYSFVSAAILAISSSVFAADATLYFDTITVPANLQVVPVGSTLDITWDPTTAESINTDTVTINLLQGATQSTLQYASSPVASSIKNSLGTYAWTVPSAVFGYATYGFQIVDASNSSLFQYSYPFSITDDDATNTTTSSIGSATTTVQLIANTAYTSSATSAITTSAAIVANATSVLSTPSATAISNLTATLTTLTSAKSATATSTKTSGTTSSSTSSSTSKVSNNAAMGNLANGGLAMVGAALMALAL